eukprot:TRINITY_DN2469_c0_g1_i1.p1 TRINITY_DN2469_c0_g1~~TRINITY_DN2469_c0_g1_i1.p1  ORF type:complete len:388 (-),score=74.90 TRINITY_DN2469_c0_g1_i1:186-1349(-)
MLHTRHAALQCKQSFPPKSSRHFLQCTHLLSRGRLKQAENVVFIHTSSVLNKKKKKTRYQEFMDKIVPQEDLNKRPSDLEIFQKDLPKNQPTLKERIERDRWHMFYQQDIKHGYWQRQPTTLMEDVQAELKKNPKKALTESFKVVKSEVAKFNQERKDGDYSIRKGSERALFREGDRKKEWGFQSELEMDEWILTMDSDWGEGYSSAEFKLNDAGTAGVLSGDLSTRVPMDGRTGQAGYVNIASANQRKSFGRLKVLHHWMQFTHLTMNIRGDGRKYNINLKVKRDFDMTWDDRWVYPMYTRGGPYWQYVKIPFSKFIFAHKGNIQDRQNEVNLFHIQGISFTLKDRITGPFRLEIKDISLQHDAKGDDEVFAYEMYRVPSFWIGSG